MTREDVEAIATTHTNITASVPLSPVITQDIRKITNRNWSVGKSSISIFNLVRRAFSALVLCNGFERWLKNKDFRNDAIRSLSHFYPLLLAFHFAIKLKMLLLSGKHFSSTQKIFFEKCNATKRFWNLMNKNLINSIS